MDDKGLDQNIRERFKELPKVVQDAITSADVEKRMRALADTQKLHLDQWESLENEVMLALLGFQPVENLEKNIQEEVGVSAEVARALTEEISKIVFEPIRQELERQLEHPEARAEAASGVEEVRQEALRQGGAQAQTPAETAQATPPAPAVAPATPPAPANEDKAERAPLTESYKPGQASNARKTIADDPYREPPA